MLVKSARRDPAVDDPTAAARKTILIVEDDVEIRDLLRLALEDEGLQVESAADGLHALQRVRQETPDLVILDLNMPRMGGVDFLYAWRTGIEAPEVPVIVITAAAQALRAQDLGVEAVFEKPFDIEMLLRHVRDLLAMPFQVRASAGGRGRAAEMVRIVDDLANALSTLTLCAEQVADAPELPASLQTMATSCLDAAHRASVLTQRLNHLVNAST
jgi:DNA-binding response OmpR family regulator